jgi:S-DNA-T family DNA segregation ATPase FtsK/SpoIIIE
VRLGPGEIVPIQTALVTCITEERDDAAVDVAPFRFGPTVRDRAGGEPATAVADQAARGGRSRRVSPTSDLARLVDAIVDANEAEGIPPPRRPWPEPLPTRIDLADLMDAAKGEPATTAVVALADDPRRQEQYPVGWDLTQGNLLLFGIPGSGTTSALVSLALSLAAKLPPSQLELYALDFGVGELAPLEQLPHTGSVVVAGDRERQMRLVRHLRAELDRRRERRRQQPRTVVLIDNFSAMRAEFDDVEGLAMMDELTRVFADGPEVGINIAIAADRVNAVPGALAALTTQRWLFRLADPYDYASVGLGRKHIPHATPGRAVMVSSEQQVQLGLPGPSLEKAVSVVARRHKRSARRASAIGVLPPRVTIDELGEDARLREEPWMIPVGLRESDLTAARLSLYEGEHAAVAGPARSGKSMTLWTIAEAARRADPKAQVFGAGGRRSPLRNCPALDRFGATSGEANGLFALARVASGPTVVLIDDAGGFEDLDGTIQGLVSAAPPNVHVVCAASADVFRTLYGHWTQAVRRSKVGVLLRPNVDLDGDLLGVTLPRRSPVAMVVGRGYLVQNGEFDIVQVALDPRAK